MAESVCISFKDGITLPVPDQGRLRRRNRQRGWTPGLAALFISQVDDFPGGSETGSLLHGVSRFVWLFSDQVNPRPLSETRNPNIGLAITLDQGAGARRG